jgi:hypothetical protein
VLPASDDFGAGCRTLDTPQRTSKVDASRRDLRVLSTNFITPLGNLQSTYSASTFAAQMKSLPVNPPHECVEYRTMQRLYETIMSG